jgi:uncharacterized protein YcbX
MLVDERGEFLSQRRIPKMALINTVISGDNLNISIPGQPDSFVPLNSHGGDDIEVKIWEDQCLAKTTSQTVDNRLSQFLDMPCRLVYHAENRVRKVDPDYAKPSDETAFSDGFPFLIVSASSLVSLNQAMSENFDMRRFRPNLVISDCHSYAEDGWRKIRIGSLGFRLPKPCSRCAIPTIDPDTAVSGKEPLTTLARLRRWQKKVYFGQNALHDGVGELTVGDEVVIVEQGELQPFLQATGS